MATGIAIFLVLDALRGQPSLPAVRSSLPLRWEDEEEFDGVAGSLLLPKTLHVVSVPSAARRRSPGGGDEALVHVAAALVRTGPVDASHSSFAGGFCSSQVRRQCSPR